MAKKREILSGTALRHLHGAKRASLPTKVRPALAEPAAEPPLGTKWLHEIKLDGYRMFCRKEGQTVQFLSRNNQDWTARFGPLSSEASELLAESALLDGEVVVTREDGTTSFQALQNALSESATEKLVYYAFDLLYLNGYDITAVKLEERKELLAALLGDSAVTRMVFSEHIVGNGPTVFEQARRMGVEGIISKRRDHPYRPGRTLSWKKVKCTQSDDFVIAGYTAPSKAAYGFGALLVGQLDEEQRLQYAGRVGTGFSAATRKHLAAELLARKMSESPFEGLPAGEGGRDVQFVEPELIAHVEYLERTGDNLLRHASFRGLREDLAAEDAARGGPAAPQRRIASLPRDLADVEEIRFTHPDRVLYPEEGISKLAIATYYAIVAERMLPYVRGRPLSLVRCPHGIHEPCFFQKRPPKGLSDHVRRVEVPSGEGSETAMVVDDTAGLLSLVQFDVVEIHTWAARADRLDRPDRIVFDLDPHESISWQRVQEAAVRLRTLLTGQSLQSYLLATGGKGLHVVVPITRRYGWDRVRDFSREVAKELAATSSRQFTLSPSLKARSGKIYIDYLRNQRGATAIAPYSTRARSGATVAIPLSWEELPSLRSPNAFNLMNVPRRLAAERDPWEGFDGLRQYL